MEKLLKAVFKAEIWCGLSLAALGDVWAASALRRLKKFVGEPSENIGGSK